VWEERLGALAVIVIIWNLIAGRRSV